MAISEQQEAALSNARASSSRQDKKMPFLINRNDGRLYPNTPLMRKHADYIPYTGSVSATREERMVYLRTGSTRQRLIINSTVEEDETPFDIGKATAEELVAFALNTYGAALDQADGLKKLRNQVAKLAEMPTTI